MNFATMHHEQEDEIELFEQQLILEIKSKNLTEDIKELNLKINQMRD